MEAALKYSGHNLSTKSLMIMLSVSRIPMDANFAQMNPIYDVSMESLREYLVRHFNE